MHRLLGGATDTLGGVAPNPTTLPQKITEDKTGGGRAVQWERSLKASDQSLRLVSTPRLPGLIPGAGCRKPYPKSKTP
jgi:hypothetical protein